MFSFSPVSINTWSRGYSRQHKFNGRQVSMSGGSAVASSGSVVQFEDGKKKRLMLGVVQSSESKGKKGFVYHIADAANRKHDVPSKALQIVLPPSPTTKPGATVSEILADYLAVAECSPTELGVDIDMLELAWEVCESEEVPSHTAESIMNQIDDSLFKTSLQQYKAFRLLSSDLGNIFFNVLHEHDISHREYKAKSAASVADNKVNWCKAVEEGVHVGSDEWCFV
uniref:Ribonuclease II winged helix domain-containing protein n=1 Tax=Octactis speculum TaxID=3111310 RepID=A0A7S2H2Y7_9STRA